MRGFLLDTNHVGELVKRGSPLTYELEAHERRGFRFGVCVPVLCELEAGIQGHARYKEKKKALARLLASVSIWPLEEPLAAVYGEMFRFATAKGKVLFQVDMILAAMARMERLTILSTDKDFAVFRDLRVENWLK